MYDSELIDCGVCFVIMRGDEIRDAAATLSQAFEKSLPLEKPVRVLVARVEALVTHAPDGLSITWVANPLSDDQVVTLSA